MRKLFLCILIFLMLFTTVLVQAQDEMRYGDSVRGEIEDADNESDLYFFEGSAGDKIILSVTSDDTDPIVALGDEEGNILGYNDDISSTNFDSELEYIIEADGVYLVQVTTYTAGSYTLTLEGVSADSGGGDQGDSSGEGTYTGTIDNRNPYAEFQITLEAGRVVTLTATATSGDLDTYVYLIDSQGNVVAENDDINNETLNSQLEYEVETSGSYIAGVTRYNFEEGDSTGDFELVISTGEASSTTSNNQTSTFEENAVTPDNDSIADWTILAYMGGDNNLEEAAIVDMNEFEMIGSDDQVRVIALLDRSPDYDTSNDDWTTTRIYELNTDSGDYDPSAEWVPIIDSEPLFDLGATNSGSGELLTEFLVWGIENFPAENYVIEINDHGGGWTGLVSDDTEGGGMTITLPEYEQAFRAATEAAGVDRFALLINDACLMSSVEYLTMIAPYFDYTLGAAEIMYGPGYNLSILTQGLKEGAPIEEIGTVMIDYYMEEMTAGGLDHDQTPTLIDLREFPAVVDALSNFTSLYNSYPEFYAETLGNARYNTYEYGQDTWLSFLVDAGDLMSGVQYFSQDQDLSSAAQDVIDAMQNTVVYSQRGSSVPEAATLININFPTEPDEYISDYYDINPLTDWNDMLSNYYNGYAPSRVAAPVSRSAQAQNPTPQPTLPPSENVIPESNPPQVSIVSVYPADAVSINHQAIVSMEVVGRNVARGTFTVDQVLEDGTVRRVDTTDIVTFVELDDGTFDYINLWSPGVDDFDFTWSPVLSTLTDGTTTDIELITSIDDQSYIRGRYRDHADATWLEARLTFNDDGVAVRGVSTGESGQGLAGSFQIREGGEFQAYNSVVTADGRVVDRPGNSYLVPADGLRLGYTNAPSGDYNLGFLIEALGGVTGFNSVEVTVDNNNIDDALIGYTTLVDGFTVQYPADWSTMEYFSEREFYSTNDADAVQSIYVYPIYDATDLESTLDGFTSLYPTTLESDPAPITVDGYDALEFDFTSEDGTNVYNGRGFALYKADAEVGLVFTVERTDGGDVSEIYQLLLDGVELFDVTNIQANNRGEWEWDFYTDETYYPIPRAWLPGEENDFGWIYRVPDSDAFISMVVYQAGDIQDARDFLQQLLGEYAGEYTVESVDTYFGAHHTWEVANYKTDEVSGRFYVTIQDGVPYAIWFEAPKAEVATLFPNYFEPILDGFEITVEE